MDIASLGRHGPVAFSLYTSLEGGLPVHCGILHAQADAV